MENKKAKIGITALGVLAMGAVNTNSNPYTVSDLGTGAELRSELLNSTNNFIDVDALSSTMELSCGEKSKESKCGEKTKESKCGEEANKKKAKKTKKATKEEKTKESKCGESKCGESKCGG